MMLRNSPAFLILAVLLIPAIARAAPSNYDECILESMKGVSSDIAAQAIISSCRNLFPAEETPVAPVAPVAAPQTEKPAPAQEAPAPKPAPQPDGPARSLTLEELDRVGVRTRVFGSTYNITFHNKNEHLTVTEVTIAVWDESDSSSLREYQKEVRVAPGESVAARYTVHYKGSELSWAWKVASAKGFDLSE